MRTYFLPVAFFFSLVCFLSCTGKNETTIIGKWTPVAVDSQFIRTNHVSEKDFQDMYTNVSVEFTIDGKFISIDHGDSSQGTYTYDQALKRLATVEPGGKTETFSVNFLPKDKIAISDQDGTMTLARK